MNAVRFRANIFGVIAFYIFALAFGLGLAWRFGNGDDDSPYKIWVSVQPLIVAIPLAWLSYCFQRRQAYIKDVRELWTRTVKGVQTAIQYTYGQEIDHKSYSRVMFEVSSAIDELRGVWLNINEGSAEKGYYPIESLKQVRDAISKLGYTSFEPAVGKIARDDIVAAWAKAKPIFLTELPRESPANKDSTFALVARRDAKA